MLKKTGQRISEHNLAITSSTRLYDVDFNGMPLLLGDGHELQHVTYVVGKRSDYLVLCVRMAECKVLGNQVYL